METLTTLFIPSVQGSEDILCEPYEISYEPMTSNLRERLSSEEFSEFMGFYENAFKEPGRMCLGLEEFKEKHPGIPEVDNLLSYVYILLGRIRQAERLIQESYKKYPDYLFARINYADQALRKRKYALIPQIFDHHLTLRALYPQRKLFHFSEFRGFMVVMGYYHLAIGKTHQAESYYHLAMCVDPLHRSVRALEVRLFKLSFIKKIFKSLLAFFQ